MKNRLIIAIATAFALCAALWLGNGCENNTDVLSENGSTITGFYVSPGSVTLHSLDNYIVLTAYGGTEPYSWSVVDTNLGVATGVNSNGMTQSPFIIYKRKTTGDHVNRVTVQDSHGWTAYATVTSDALTGLVISPSIATLGTNDTSQAFTVSGGLAPYSWNSKYAALGTISYASGTTATYTRTTGTVGQNIIYVQDDQGRITQASVIQQ